MPSLAPALRRVLEHQRKLHRWDRADPDRWLRVVRSWPNPPFRQSGYVIGEWLTGVDTCLRDTPRAVNPGSFLGVASRLAGDRRGWSGRLLRVFRPGQDFGAGAKARKPALRTGREHIADDIAVGQVRADQAAEGRVVAGAADDDAEPARRAAPARMTPAAPGTR